MSEETTLTDEERQPCEVWTRVMGYHRPVSEFNKGKQAEFKTRKCFVERKTMTLKQEIMADEGFKGEVYLCSRGQPTIGYGHVVVPFPACDLKFLSTSDKALRLTAGRKVYPNGISKSEAEDILNRDIEKARFDLFRKFPIAKTLSQERQDVLINMSFNMGIGKLAGFKKMWAAIEKGDFNEASKQMLDSLWAKQVKTRANRLAQRMKDG